MVEVKPVDPAYADEWLAMRCALWPDASRDELRDEVASFFTGSVPHLLHVLLAIEAGHAVGFVELNIRPYAEGCASGRVAFLEGWFVSRQHRTQQVGALLIAASERWAREQGCTEFASDALYDNELGRAAHLGVGFEEVEAIRCFRKAL